MPSGPVPNESFSLRSAAITMSSVLLKLKYLSEMLDKQVAFLTFGIGCVISEKHGTRRSGFVPFGINKRFKVCRVQA